MQEDEDRIRSRAHAIWEREGRPDGRSQAHWDKAREEIAIEDNQRFATRPNPAAEGRVYATAEDSAEELTAVEESFPDVPGPSAQGERDQPYPAKRTRRRSNAT